MERLRCNSQETIKRTTEECAPTKKSKMETKYEEMETQAKASNASNRVSMSPVSQPATLKREEGVDEPNETFDDGLDEGK